MKRRMPQYSTASAGLLASLLLLIAFCASARTQAGGTQQTATTGARAGVAQTNGRVSIPFTALDKDEKFLATLKPEDIRVTVDGNVQQITEFRRRTDVPLLLAVAIDASASQELVLPNVKLAADVFLKGMMQPGRDKAAVVSFSGDVKVEQGMTEDLAKVREAAARVVVVVPAGYLGGGIVVGTPSAKMKNAGSTSVWDAVRSVSNDVLPRSLGEQRRALLLITDGVDTSSRVNFNEAVASAIKSETAVYALGIGDSGSFDGVDKDHLRKLAERTGGRAFFPRKTKELADVFTQIREELVSQYVVTFAPNALMHDGSFHKIKIEIVNPDLRKQDLQLAYPQGFYAGNTTASVRK